MINSFACPDTDALFNSRNISRFKNIERVAQRKLPVTADTALRLGLFFGMELRFWLNLQSEYDMRIATRNLTNKITPRIRVFHKAAI